MPFKHQITKKCITRSKIKISSNNNNSTKIYDGLRLYSVPALPPLTNNNHKLFQRALGLNGKVSKMLCLASHIVGGYVQYIMCINLSMK